MARLIYSMLMSPSSGTSIFINTQTAGPGTLSGMMRALAISVLVLATTGCSLASRGTYPADAPGRAAVDTPDRFMVGTIPPGGDPSEPQPNAGCRNPMVDPRDGAQLTLVRSQPGENGQIGDYVVPDGRYGGRPGELLRLDCGTGRPIGFVPRRG